jgi:uncharacterized membrane protein YfcA
MADTLNLFSANEWLLVILMFVWAGFVRTGLGFGGAALGLPIMLLLRPDPLLWLPVVATHLLFFTFITVIRRMSNVDWTYLRRSMKIMIIPKMIGVVGLVILPTVILVVIVYGIILAFALSNIFNYKLSGKNKWSERFFLILGAYASGISLVGAPLIVAAYSQHVAIRQLRDTLFVLWFILVCIKMSALAALHVPLQWQLSILLLPAAGIGHMMGLRVHEKLISGDDVQFRRYLGIGLAAVSIVGLINVLVK